MSSMEKEHRYKDGNGRWHTVVLWETVLETPYTVDFCVEEVRHLIQELFQDDEDGNWPIEKIGITGDYPKGYANMIYDKDWREEYRNYNVMLERRLKANYRTGFWEMIFLHTKPLAAVPSDMRAGRNSRAQRHFGFDKIACPKGLAIGCRTGYTNTKNAEKMY